MVSLVSLSNRVCVVALIATLKSLTFWRYTNQIIIIIIIIINWLFVDIVVLKWSARPQVKVF